MTIILVGLATDEIDVPTTNSDNGDPNPELEYEDSEPSADWWGGLMADAGLDDNYYFEKWNEDVKTFGTDFSEWTVTNGTTETWGVNYTLYSGDWVFEAENKATTTGDGYETWMSTYSRHGETFMSIVQYYDEDVNGIRSIVTDKDGNVVRNELVHNARMVNGMLVYDVSTY